MSVDVLAVGAHPDDVEVGIGALVHKLTSSGYSAGILDLTEGEMGTRGTVEERRREAAEAARILGVSVRKNAQLPDGSIANTPEQRKRVAEFIREFRPRMILAPMNNDRHPDHAAAHTLVSDANYQAGLAKLDVAHEPYRAPVVYFYCVYVDSVMPHMVVDVSGHFDAHVAALRAFASQFHNPSYAGTETYVSSATFWESIHDRAVYWGKRIRASHGIPLCASGPIPVSLPPGLRDMPCE